MTDPEIESGKLLRRLAIIYCVFGILQSAVGVAYLFFNDEFTSIFLGNIFIKLPEIEGIISFILWIWVAIADILIFIAAIFLLIAWQILAPVVALMAIPSLVGGVGSLYKKIWANKILLYTSISYGLIFFPCGVVMTVFTIKAYRQRQALQIL